MIPASGVALQTGATGFGVVALGPVAAILQLLAFTAAAAVTGAVVAAVYRWYSRRRAPAGPTLLFGLATVAVYLNTVGLYGALLVGGDTSLFTPAVILFNVAALLVGGAGAGIGRVLGDRIATDAVVALGGHELDADVGRMVRSIGRVTPVELPPTIEDMEGYDPVGPDVKAELAGKRLLFPTRLTVAELRDRLVTRLKRDYGVGHVDLELTDEGAVTYLAVGTRVAGVGPTLAPGTVACTIRADPGAGASPGDVVQVWRTDPSPEPVLTGELRATADAAATLAVDAAEAAALDGQTTYRLVTLPAEPRIEREFAAALRAADETMRAMTVAADSPLAGRIVGDVDAALVAVGPSDGPVEAIPSRDRVLAPGDTLYAVARPEALRRLEALAGSAGVGGDRPDAQPS